MLLVRHVAIALLGAPLVAAPACAQAGYYNLDAGRPTRIEDAVTVERYGLDLQLAPSRFERLDGGALRWRAEPKLSFGAMPMTELEVRMPLVYTRAASGGASRFGASGVGIGALHALTLEAGRVPALAVAGEALLPAGSGSGARTSYSVRALLTHSTVAGRVHLNATVGTYALPSARRTAPSGPAGNECPPGTVPAPGGGCVEVPVIPDPPCMVMATMDDASAPAPPAIPPAPSRPRAQLFPPDPPRPRLTGERWMLGIAGDHAFPLQSTLVSVDLFAEHFSGPYRATEWTAEGGARHQWSPRLVIDAGMSRRLTGPAPSFSLTLGATYAFALRPGH